MTTCVCGTGSYLPETIVTNDDLSKMVDTSDEWITSRTGIRERHIAKNVTTTEMAYQAALRAIEDAGVEVHEIDLIIVASFTGDICMPSIACKVQGKLGNVSATCFDVNAACSGFIYGLATAHGMIMSGQKKCALIIGAERLSKVVDWSDRGTCVLFGDGAGAAVLKNGENGIESFVTGSNGSQEEVLYCEDSIAMNGQEVFKFAVGKVPECILELLEKTGDNPDDIDLYVLHQANARIISSVAKRLKVSEEKFPTNLERCGNTSAASIPILLDELNRSKKLQKGNSIIMAGFGGGLTWGAVKLTW